jgi:hypothetical protein
LCNFTQKIEDPKLITRKLKIPKFQIPKQKTFKVYKKKSKYLNSPFVKLHTKKIKDPQNEKKKIEDS